MLAIENPEPQDAKRDHRDQTWNIKQRPVERQALDLGVQQHRQNNRNGRRKGYGCDHIGERIPNRHPEDLILNHLFVVLKADKARRAENREVGEAVEKRCHYRIEEEGQKTQNPRHGEEIGYTRFRFHGFASAVVMLLPMTCC